MYVVRERHAHAWAIAYIDGHWQTVDTTPQVWAETEAAQSSWLRPIADWIDNATFLLQVWWNTQKLEDYEVELYVLGGLLVLILIWRIATSEQVIISEQHNDATDNKPLRPGADSPFYRIEQFLQNAGLDRGRSEPLRPWLLRIGHDELVPMLTIHDKLRFDPHGAAADHAVLAARVDDWLAQHTSA